MLDKKRGRRIFSTPLRARRAFSYMEILIALAILTLAVFPSMNMFTFFKQYTLHTEDIQIALRLAQEKIEEYKAASFAELKALINAGKKNPEPEVLVNRQTNTGGLAYTNPQYVKFKRKITLSFLNNDPEMVLITVHVWWYEGMFAGGDQRFIVLKSLVCKDLVL